MNIPKNRPPLTPGEMLKEGFLDEMAISQTQLAEHLGWSKAKVTEIIRGKRRVTTDIAFCLADAFQTSPEFWLNLQLAVDIAEASKQHRKRPPIAS